MPRNYDASALTQRRAQLAASAGFSSHTRRPMNAPYDASFLSAVRVGAMTEYTRFNTCVGISPGCPCGPLASSLLAGTPALPGFVSGIVFTIGSITVTWNAPTEGDGPFQYTITPMLNGTPLPSVTTTALTYTFTALEEWQPYTFTVTASNAVGQGPLLASTVCLAPPADLSAFMASLQPAAAPFAGNTTAALAYILNAALEDAMKSTIQANVGPTRGARLMYLYVASLAQAWNWVTADTSITGIHDNWDWSQKSAAGPLADVDTLVWMMCVTKYLNSFLSTVPSLFVCPAEATARVKVAGGWEAWRTAWSSWYAQRMSDGSIAATVQPTASANWNETIVVEGSTDIGAFPAPQEWTRLTVNGVKQNYLTYEWAAVASTCLTPAQEATLLGSVTPVYGADRDAEIDMVLTMSADLTDQEKAIAEFWAGSALNAMSPPLMCLWLCKEYLRASVMARPDSLTPKMMVYSLLDTAVHLFEGSRVTWGLKAQFMQARPIQEIRRRYAGQTIASWNGIIDGSRWVPYQSPAQVTPPFADFPSGHSHFSKAFALTMEKWFGPVIEPFPLTYNGEAVFSPCLRTETTTFGTFTVPAGSSTVQPNTPSVPVTLTFGTWEEMAAQAGMSRLYGGIHCTSAHVGSQTVAVEIDAILQGAWNISV